jgi:pimeloyl-ACP methyl ester carboxylesterase
VPPTSSGYVDVGRLELYHERHGHGAPVILLHGALGTIETCFAALLPALARRFEVIAVELQGHGHTRDVPGPLTYESMAADLVSMLEILEIQRSHFVGYSMGGALALRLALDHPQLVDHLVFAGGAAFDTRGLHPQLTAMFDAFDPHELDGSAWHQSYRAVAPELDGWTSLVVKTNELDRAGVSWPKERLAALRVPTLLVIGDADVVRPEHTVEMFRLLGGGVPGDLVTLPPAQLAVLPGTSHVGLLARPEWLSSMIHAFLAPARTPPI